MASAVSAKKRLQFVNVRASREECERLDALATAGGVSRSEFVREAVWREVRRQERERRVKESESYYTCTCAQVKPGVFCALCGYPKRWTVYRQWQARERMRRRRETSQG